MSSFLCQIAVGVEVFITVSLQTTLANEAKVGVLLEMQLFYISSDLSEHSQELVDDSFEEVEVEESQQSLFLSF